MRKNYAASLLNGFSAAYDLTGRVMRDRDLKKIVEAQPVEQKGDFVPVQNETDPSQAPVDVQAPPKFAFLGQNYDTAPDAASQDKARQLAMAGVFDKYGEVERGAGLRQGVRRDEIAQQGLELQKATGEREAQRFDWQKQAKATEEAWQTNRQQLFNDSAFGRSNATYAKALDSYHTQMKSYQAAIDAGDRSAVEPTQPPRPNVSVGDALLDHATLLANDVKYGKADSAAMVNFAELVQKVHNEGYGQTLTLAQSGAPLTQVIEQFNKGGDVKLDPAAIVSDKMVDRGSGVKSRVITVKRPDGSTQVIDTLAELDSLGKADKVFSRAFQMNADRRGNSADARGWAAEGRQQAEFESGKGERAGKAALGNLQAELLDPKTTPARAQEIQGRLQALQGVMGKAKPESFKVEAGDVTSLLGTPAVDRKGEPIMDIMTGRQVVNRDPAKEQAFFKWMADNNITDTNKGLALYPPLQGRGPQPASSGGGPKKGDVVDGYRFNGGDPKDKNAWVKE